MNSRHCHRNFVAKGSKRAEGKNYYCCVHEDLTNADDELEILDVFMIPELHIFTGIVNRLVQALNEKWNWDNGHQDAFYKWCDKHNILYTGFRGKVWSMTCIHFALIFYIR